MNNEIIQRIRDVHEIQGRNGNWNYDSYMMGLYNGLELALSIAEDRSPDFRMAPKEWIADKPIDEILGEVESE